MNETILATVDEVRKATPRKGRGGRRSGAGRKPNLLKQLALRPITAAEIVGRRHPLSAELTPEELATLESITLKLAAPSPDAFRNQKESNTAIFGPEPILTLKRVSNMPVPSLNVSEDGELYSLDQSKRTLIPR